VPADLSSSCPLVAADAARAELEQACRRLLAAGWETWRLRGQLEELARHLSAIERRPGAVSRFVGGESAEKAAEKRGNGKR
jgi:hypothetical protein